MSETSLPGQLPAAVAPSDGRPSTPAGPAGNPELLRFNSNSGDEGDPGRDAPSGGTCSTPNAGTLSTAVRHNQSQGGRGSRSLPLTPMATLTVNRTSTRHSTTSGGEKRPRNSKLRILEAADKDVALAQIEQFKDSRAQRYRVILRLIVGRIQKYSVPLVLGVTIALTWNNIDEESYHNFIDGAIIEGAAILDSDLHGLSLHFIVNDFFMCFFFGLAIKEVTEALLPGGCLHPLKKAVNPLLATLGGVVGPVVTYAIMVALLFAAGSFDGQLCVTAAGTDGHRRLGGGGGEVQTGPSEPCTLGGLLKGWGVPTATDISLAWMFAVIIFGAGHPAINFLLLLAIVDDALGMVIIAVFYPDPNNPVQPLWLGLVLASMVIAYGLRRLKVQSWPVFVAVCGPFSWLGLFKSHVHPALALVFIVPFMPACHAIEADIDGTSRDLGACDLGPKELEVYWPSQGSSSGMDHVPTQNSHKSQHTQGTNPPPKQEMPPSPAMKKMKTAINLIAGISEEEAPLHQFEHQLKLPVDLGMFFFGLANAGVRLGSLGGITASVGVALLVGKTLGIALFSLLGVWLGFGLPDGVTVGNLFSMSAIAGVGLTVALFVANEAFIDPELRGQAKMGAVLSVACGGVGWLLERLLRKDEFLEFN